MSDEPLNLYLVPLGPTVSQDVVQPIYERLPRDFPGTPRLLPMMLDTSFALDRLRNQYLAPLLIEKLLENLPQDTLKCLAIADIDLCTKVLAYVFGMAQLNGKIAIVSLHRLRPEFYGVEPCPQLLKSRVIREALHELGHAFGLTHCRRPDCVMRLSLNVHELDQKADQFCLKCQTNLLDEKL